MDVDGMAHTQGKLKTSIVGRAVCIAVFTLCVWVVVVVVGARMECGGGCVHRWQAQDERGTGGVPACTEAVWDWDCDCV